MNEYKISAVSRIATRAALIAAGIYLAVAVGAPWLINSAPPSLQDVIAAQVCCVKAAPKSGSEP